MIRKSYFRAYLRSLLRPRGHVHLHAPPRVPLPHHDRHRRHVHVPPLLHVRGIDLIRQSLEYLNPDDL